MTSNNEEIVKTCKHHGALTRDKVVKKCKSATGKQLYRCKECLKIFHRNHYEKNAERLKAQVKEFNENNRELYITRKRVYSKKYREKHCDSERARMRKMEQRQREQLHDAYIKKLITKRSILLKEDIPQKLIDLKRALLLLKRQLNNDKRTTTNGEDKND